MTHAFSATSRERAKNVDRALWAVAELALPRCKVDFGITEPQTRSVADQQKKFDQKVSKVRPGPDARHMVQPDGSSKALDLVPFIDGKFQWGDHLWRVNSGGVFLFPFHEIALAMRSAAIELKTKVRWGAVWDRTLDELPADLAGIKRAVEDYKVRHAGVDFLDGPHFELPKH